MEKLTVMRDDLINKDYTLQKTTIGELRLALALSANMSVQEIRTGYDTLAPIELDKLEDKDTLTAIWDKEVKEVVFSHVDKEKSYKAIIKALTISDDYDKNHSGDTYPLIKLIGADSYMQVDTNEVYEQLKPTIKEMLKTKDFDELITYVKEHREDMKTSWQADYSMARRYNFDLKNILSQGVTKKAFKDMDIRDYSYISYLLGENDLRRELSPSYQAYQDKESDNRKNETLSKRFNQERVVAAKEGIENYVFVTEEFDGKLILLDGFNRLFGSAYSNDDKEILVKQYSDLNEEEWAIKIFNLNDWKIKGRHLESFYNRGVLFSLKVKYGIDVEHIKSYYRLFSTIRLNMDSAKDFLQTIRDFNQILDEFYALNPSDNLIKAFRQKYSGKFTNGMNIKILDEIEVFKEHEEFEVIMNTIERYKDSSRVDLLLTKKGVKLLKC